MVGSSSSHITITSGGGVETERERGRHRERKRERETSQVLHCGCPRPVERVQSILVGEKKVVLKRSACGPPEDGKVFLAMASTSKLGLGFLIITTGSGCLRGSSQVGPRRGLGCDEQ